MSQKVIIMLCSLALTKGGILKTDFSPGTTASYSSSSTPSTISTENPKLSKVLKLPLDYTRIYPPSPLYESVLDTEESKLKTADETESAIFSKSITTGPSNVKKVDSRSIKDKDFIGSNNPIFYSRAIHQEPVFYDSQNADSIPTSITYETSTPILTKSTYTPVPYETHLNNIKYTSLDNIKAISDPASIISSLNSKTSTSDVLSAVV